MLENHASLASLKETSDSLDDIDVFSTEKAGQYIKIYQRKISTNIIFKTS